VAKAIELASVERRALDETFPCVLWFGSAELIHVYQTDSSSKPPAPEDAFKKLCEINLGNLLTRVVPYQGGGIPKYVLRLVIGEGTHGDRLFLQGGLDLGLREYLVVDTEIIE
jgi:hypothetical protein